MDDHHKQQDCSNLDIHTQEFASDPYPTYERLRVECPVSHSDLYGEFWLITGYDDVKNATLDWRTFTSSVPGVTAIPIITRRDEPQLPLELDPPLHSHYRALVNPVFSAERISALRPKIEEIADSLIDMLLTDGVCDLVVDFAIPLSVQTMAIFTGLPTVDSNKWVSWIQRMFDVHHPQDSAKASTEFGHYIDELISTRRKNPSNDFIGILLESEVEGKRLTDKEIHAFCTLLFGAGFETTADALSVMLYQLTQNPQDFIRLKSDPSLIPIAVEEYVRFASPIQIFGRNATKDIEIHGQHIKKDDVVALSFGSANHDPNVFDNPESCVIDRKPNKHLAFGAGIHLCLGAPVARLEMVETLETLVKRVKSLTLNGDVKWKSRGDRRGLQTLPVTLCFE